MEIKGNKGELSELYAFFKLLADGRIYSGDGELNRYAKKYYPILEIFRDDAEERNTYRIQTANESILVIGEQINIEIPQARFLQEAQILLENIKKDKTDYSYLETFLQEIDCTKIKAKSKDKADIRLVIHNFNNGTISELGYSIKSRLGAPSTLINSNKNGTNFIYEIEGITSEQAEKCNNLDRFKNKFAFLQSIGANILFVQSASEILHNNLTLLDLGLERIIAFELLEYYKGNNKTLVDITKQITMDDPLCIMCNTSQPMYEYKIKQFLLAFALGMTSSTPWNGNFNANGGYIVVKEDGDIVCYHFFDRNDLENYFFNNTYFDTPSTTRHQFGDIYQQDGKFYIKLNMQVRFK